LHRVIGIDFDNTLVNYDDLIHRVAVERGLIPPQAPTRKKGVRDSIRLLPEGEVLWQKVQAEVYGPRMNEALPAPAAKEFLRACAERNIPVSIVSHKTEFANYDESGINLRDAALAWIEQHGLFEIDSYGLSAKDVYFETTRAEKLGRIEALECTHFIDDLEETFLEKDFPQAVEMILYTPEADPEFTCEVALAAGWPEIRDYFFK